MASTVDTMIDELLNATYNEALAFMASIQDDELGSGTVIKKTDFKAIDGKVAYTMPLLMVGLVDGQETSQYPGGCTRVDWMFSFDSYHYDPDLYMGDDTGYPATLQKVVELVRDHFTKEQWLVTGDNGMDAMMVKWDWGFTLVGISRADALGVDGLCNGYKVMLDSMGLDRGQNRVVMSSVPLESFEQTNYPPAQP